MEQFAELNEIACEVSGFASQKSGVTLSSGCWLRCAFIKAWNVERSVANQAK